MKHYHQKTIAFKADMDEEYLRDINNYYCIHCGKKWIEVLAKGLVEVE